MGIGTSKRNNPTELPPINARSRGNSFIRISSQSGVSALLASCPPNNSGTAKDIKRYGSSALRKQTKPATGIASPRMPKKTVGFMAVLKQLIPHSSSNEKDKHVTFLTGPTEDEKAAWFEAAYDGCMGYLKGNVVRCAGCRNDEGLTALMICAVQAHAHCINTLADEQKLQTNIGMTALMMAAENDSYECVAYLRGELTMFNQFGETALIIAAKRNNDACVERLTGECMLADPEGKSALMWAVIRGNVDVMEYLGDEIGLTDLEGKTALIYACIYRRHNCIPYVISEYEIADDGGKKPINYAHDNSDTDALRLLKTAELNAIKRTEARSARITASFSAYSHNSSVHFSSSARISVGSTSDSRPTLRFKDFLHGRHDMSFVASNIHTPGSSDSPRGISHGRGNMYQTDDQSPCTSFSVLGPPELCGQVQSADDDQFPYRTATMRYPHTDDIICISHGTCPLPLHGTQSFSEEWFKAAQNGDLSYIENNMSKNFRSVDSQFNNTLMIVCKNGHSHCIPPLLAEMGISNTSGMTALMYAASGGHIECIKQLTPEQRIRNLDGRTALMHAVLGNHPDVIQYLQREIGQYDNDDWTALMLAAQHGYLECAEKLLSEAGMKNNKGQTALMLACEEHHCAIVKLLVDKERNITDSQGKSALDYCKCGGLSECASILSENYDYFFFMPGYSHTHYY